MLVISQMQINSMRYYFKSIMLAKKKKKLCLKISSTRKYMEQLNQNVQLKTAKNFETPCIQL